MPAIAHPTLASIVATLGPASDSPEMVRHLIRAGVSVFRLNFSHGDLNQHAQRLATIRAAATELGVPTAVLGDLQGPKIRVGKLPAEGLLLEAGADVIFVPESEWTSAAAGKGAGCALPSTYASLASEVQAGQRVLINDGAIRLLALEPDSAKTGASGRALRCRVMVGGLVTTGKGINLPDSDVKAPAVTEKDWECVEWAVAHGLDFLALSFVRTAEEVRSLRTALAGMCPVDRTVDKNEAGAMIPVIAKIEKPQGVANIDSILEAADGIMVARGDLGVEMDLAAVPVIQKTLVEKAGDFGKPCIVATQMLETMVNSAIPTRAEASDVANAIFDGADAVMLSAETAVGKNPRLVVETMRRIILAAEARIADQTTAPSPPKRLVESRYRTAALAHGAWHTARDLGAKAIVCWSQAGGTARYLSQMGFPVPIIAYSSDQRETRRMALLRGVTAVHAEVKPSGGPGAGLASLADFNRRADADLLARGWAKAGEPILLVAGMPLGEHGATTSLAVHYIGNASTGFMRV